MRLPLLLPVACTLALSASAQQITTAAQLIIKRNSTHKELESVAIIDRKLMIPMRDGKRMAADVYRPKDTAKKYPVIFVRTPYNFNYWDVKLGAPSDMTTELDAVKRGYAYVEMNERGHFFSEGTYDILGAPLSDGDDELNWISSQPWSNGKVGTIGCSSTAEWQLGVAATNTPALAAIIPLHCLALRRAEPDPAQVPAQCLARGFDSRFEILRSRATTSSRRLVESLGASP